MVTLASVWRVDLEESGSREVIYEVIVKSRQKKTLIRLDSCTGSKEGLKWCLGGESRGLVEWLEMSQRQRGER